MYAFGVFSKGASKSVVKVACSNAGIYENDAKDYTADSMCFNCLEVTVKASLG